MWMAEFRQALRMLWRRHNRSYTAASVLMLALGIGATTAIFCVLYAVLLAPLPYRDEATVFSLPQSNPAAGLDTFSVSGPDFLSWQERVSGYSQMTAYAMASANIGDANGFEVADTVSVSPNFWQVLGMPLVLGRTFNENENRPDSDMAIIGAGLWQRRYAADPQVLGQKLLVDGQPRTIIGVAPQDAGFTAEAEVWLPAGLALQGWNRGDRRINVLGRLAPGVSRSAADAELRAVSEQLAVEFPESNRGWSAVSIPVREWIVGANVRDRVLMMGGAVLLLLLVACINVGNLQIARATTRVREIGVRQALGATRSMLMRQMVSECLVLAAIGGALGVALAAIAISLARSSLISDVPQMQRLALDWPVAAAAIAVTTLSALVCALAPAWVAARSQVASTLRSGGRSMTESQRTPMRQGLVIVQFALATLLVVTSTLLVQQFQAVQSASLGFNPEGVLTARITLPDDDNGNNYAKNVQQYARLLTALGEIPGVVEVGLGSELPLVPVNDTSMHIVPGSDAQEARDHGKSAAWRIVTSDFLSALSVPVLRGRSFAEQNESSRSLLLSESLAQRLWPQGENPVGRQVVLSNGQTRAVIGVVGDVRQRDRGGEFTPTMYMPNTWLMLSTMTLALSTQGDPAQLITQVRDVATRVVPEHPLFDISPLTNVADANVAVARQQTAVVSVFGLVSLLLAAIGIAGVTALLVTRRTPELAVRLALGATPPRVVRHVMLRAGVLSVVGVLIGTAMAAIFAHYASNFLQDTGVSIAPTLVGVASVLIIAGLIACWLPARRAASINPSSALNG